MRKLYYAAFLLFYSAISFSQNFLGLVNNNYGAYNSVMFNPAMGNKTLVGLNLATFDANVYNNYLRWTGKFNIISALANNSTYFSDSTKFSDKFVEERLNGKDKYVTTTMDIRGPSLLVGIGKFQVGLMWNRVRFGLQVSGVEERLARNLYYIGKSPVIDIANIPITDNRFVVNMNIWSESGINLAYAIKDDKNEMMRAGISVKSLNGLGAMYIKNGGTTFKFYREPGNTSTDSILYAQYDLELGFTNEFSYDPSPSNNLDTFTSTHNNFDGGLLADNILKNQKRLGKGNSFDLGFVYEKREGKKSKYKYRAAVSLIDIGSIKYNNTQFTYVTKYKGSNEITVVEGIKGYNSRQYDTAIARRFSAPAGSFKAFSMALPTTLNVSFDYRVMNHVFVNGTWIQSVRSKYTQGIRAFSSLSATPRFESRWFSAAVPVVLNDDYRNLNLGVCLSIMNCIYFGSDNIGGAFGIGKISGTDFYAGAAINIYKHKKKKKEGTETGKIIDTDKDGISDDQDDCPKEPGIAALNGCPDTDGDGVADKDDECPDVAGKVKGCPDSDGDGVADKDDKCPTVPGSIAARGCPDKDGDGIADIDDECPEIKGKPALKGCPDSDSDGVADKDDACPTIAGTIKGCPDKDNDGVADKDDKCPEIPGTPLMKGCPDSDLDGVNDADDQCPLVPGTVANFGCPAKEKDVVKVEKIDLNAEDKKALEEAFKNLEFSSGKSDIKGESKDDLDKIVEIMKRNPSYRLLIVGHTDNSGTAATNKALSLNRANAVKTYMTGFGISSNRFITKGYGPDRPIADNATEEGKQRNRRVEMTIVK